MYPINNIHSIKYQESQLEGNHAILLLFVKPSDDNAESIIKKFNYLHYKSKKYCSIYLIGYSPYLNDTYYSGGSDQSHITPYSRYRMNLRGEVNFAIKKVVVGVFATISVVDSNGDYFCASNNGGSANIGLTVGYNF